MYSGTLAETRMPRKSVTRKRKPTSHGLHLFLTIITGGAWAVFVWLPLGMWYRFGPHQMTVTRYQ